MSAGSDESGGWIRFTCADCGDVTVSVIAVDTDDDTAVANCPECGRIWHRSLSADRLAELHKAQEAALLHVSARDRCAAPPRPTLPRRRRRR